MEEKRVCTELLRTLKLGMGIKGSSCDCRVQVSPARSLSFKQQGFEEHVVLWVSYPLTV